MMKHRTLKEGGRKPAKRLLAAGRKINGTWQVKTFLHTAPEPREPFWQSTGTTRGR